MNDSIETIWKEGFLHEKSLVAPSVNDLYNRKSIHLVDRIKRRFQVNLVMIVVMVVLLPVICYFMQVIWQGVAAAILLLLTAWYNKRQIDGIKSLDQGATSFEYLRSFDRWLRDVLARSVKVARFSYPLYFLIAVSTGWSAWNRQGGGDMPLIAGIIVAAATLAVFYFSDKIYRWDVRLMYGRVFNKLERTIAEMETLKQG
ncbi:hypothetical protein JHJ32_05910 [Parapedobacter sp. ISTM3]|uniref:Uncharacterized protein n=1 Tax=Parapedobacter luteus TaxID=623280 RepID=A0A1T5BHH7_9SPHI|nr:MULTISPECIES: hypothetical protein [Parapedobacter]MBK1439511.1 hypothetical protein [Parapedobacter sp. ISTM3]SKB46460.1 hypothetical protein SAMN05660226_01467 [Parapedobacter luteus]